MGITGLVRAATAALALASGVAARADASISISSGNDLLRDCEAASSTHCMGYITGVYRGFVDASLLGSKQYICLPENVEVGRAMMVVTKYLRDNPAELSKPSDWLIIFALTKAFPCPQK